MLAGQGARHPHRLGESRLFLSRGDHVRGHHLIQHDGGAALGPLGLENRVVVARPLQQAGQQGGFADRKLGGGLVEIALGGRLDAVGAGAEIDPVQIEAENLLLGELHLQPHRQDQLLNLAADGLVRAEEQVARQLLGDGGGALGESVGAQVDEHHAHHADRIEPEVVIKAPVLDGDEGVRHIGRQVVQVHRRGVLAAAHRHQRAGAVQI